MDIKIAFVFVLASGFATSSFPDNTTAIPTPWPENINDLDMYQNDSELTFFRTNIAYLSNDVVNRLRSVKQLNLVLGEGLNKLYVKPELERLYVFYTKTQEVEIDPVNNYQITSLSVINCVLKALPRLLHILTKLEQLNFSGNKIASINLDDLNELKILKALDLYSNEIKVFGATIEISLPKIELLNLATNQLLTFETCDWKLPKLSHVDLTSNDLSHVLINLREFPEVQKISLSRNVLDCGWLRRFREKYGKIFLAVDEPCQEDDKNTTFPLDCSEAVWSQCGQQQRKIVELIVNGYDTARGFWPWHAAVYHKYGNHKAYACGGTLISRTFVLTAAHCVVAAATRKIISSEMLLVKLGMYILDQVDLESQEFAVKKIFKYDKFVQHVNDISLLELNGEVVFNTFVLPICIDYYGDLMGKYGTVVGWGFRNDDRLATQLQSTQLPVHGVLECLLSSRRFFGHTLNQGVLCAGYSNGTAVCNGDSGGGLYFQRQNIWYIGGIVSFSEFRPGSKSRCKTDGYGAFTNVSYHADWIKRIVNL